MISKELLSEIMQLGILEVGEVDDCYLSFNYYILDDDNIKACINIYELAHKCKEWALKHIINKGIQSSGCAITSWTTSIGRGKARILVIDEAFIADTEVEAVIKACEWILKEIKKC